MRIRIISPAIVTGGPELLHQLCNELCKSGFDAAMCYTPFGEQLETPQAYSDYITPQAEFEDEADVLFVIPESRTGLINYIKNARISIWWLSVDNYLARKLFPESDGGAKMRINRGLRHRIKIEDLATMDLIHFSQSFYATEFLARNGIPSYPLGDYLHSAFLEAPERPLLERRNLIAYNPKKGMRRTRQLMRKFPNFEWVALENMTRAELIDCLRQVKIYMDFGTHPGKDRIPREAVICGACLITGLNGSAENPIDIPIPSRFKLDFESPNFSSEFGELAENIMNNFPAISRDFDDYRHNIFLERSAFQSSARNLFEKFA